METFNYCRAIITRTPTFQHSGSGRAGRRTPRHFARAFSHRRRKIQPPRAVLAPIPQHGGRVCREARPICTSISTLQRPHGARFGVPRRCRPRGIRPRSGGKTRETRETRGDPRSIDGRRAVAPPSRGDERATARCPAYAGLPDAASSYRCTPAISSPDTYHWPAEEGPRTRPLALPTPGSFRTVDRRATRSNARKALRAHGNCDADCGRKTAGVRD